MARYEEFTIDKGSDISIRLELTDAGGAKKNLTDHSLRARIKKNYNDSAGEAVEFFTAIPLATQTDGVVTLGLTHSQTKGMKAGRYVFDAELNHIAAGGLRIKERVLEGVITVTPSVMDSA
tara:strand:+ start:44 stop:406 length:363 start_codon:yes stop_codon:yes gene_type:complete